MVAVLFLKLLGGSDSEFDLTWYALYPLGT